MCIPSCTPEEFILERNLGNVMSEVNPFLVSGVLFNIIELIVKESFTNVKTVAQLLITIVLLSTRELVLEGTPINVF